MGTTLLEIQGAPGQPAGGGHPPRQSLFWCLPEDAVGSTHSVSRTGRRMGGFAEMLQSSNTTAPSAETTEGAGQRSRSWKKTSHISSCLYPQFYVLISLRIFFTLQIKTRSLLHPSHSCQSFFMLQEWYPFHFSPHPSLPAPTCASPNLPEPGSLSGSL